MQLVSKGLVSEVSVSVKRGRGRPKGSLNKNSQPKALKAIKAPRLLTPKAPKSEVVITSIPDGYQLPKRRGRPTREEAAIRALIQSAPAQKTSAAGAVKVDGISPRYGHNCENCVLLLNHDEGDVYAHPSTTVGGIGQIVVRRADGMLALSPTEASKSAPDSAFYIGLGLARKVLNEA